MDKEKHLFEMVAEKDETLEGDLHIINIGMATCTWDDDEVKYRIYHKDGYCFDISKKLYIPDDDEEPVFCYVFNSEWDGFKSLNIDKAIKLLK